MSDTRERNLYIVTSPNAVHIHTVSKAALNRAETTPGATLTVVADGADVVAHLNGSHAPSTVSPS